MAGTGGTAEQHQVRAGTISFTHPAAFWCGIVACTAGVVLHVPMYLAAAPMGYRMAGMRPDGAMLAGMGLIVAGLIAVGYGLVPRSLTAPGRQVAARVRAVDEGRLTAAHAALLLVMIIAVTIDVMKPITLSFVAPGVAKEYGLKSALNPHGGLPVALLPLSGISGTVVGAFAWGWLGDRIGRRASILLAGVLFTTTAICGAMPQFSWNIAMCFMMGVGAGGMLPIAFTLIAEIVPARHRGWLLVLVGGQVATAYLLTSWLASTLVPHYSWRILWLIGLPTGLLVIALNRWIPESPRFLLTAGRTAEAEAIMARFGMAMVQAGPPGPATGAEAAGRLQLLFSRRFLGMTGAIVLLGIGAGLVTYGFQLWIPTNLQHLGLTEVTAAGVLRDSSLIGLPPTLATAWLYGFWSSKKTIILLGCLVLAALVWFVAVGNSAIDNRMLLDVMLAIPIWGIGSLAAMLVAYGAELYPTGLRARGSGLAAGAAKAGGVLIIALVVASASTPSIAMAALFGAIPLALALIALAVFGIETAERPLEDIAAIGPAPAPAQRLG